MEILPGVHRIQIPYQNRYLFQHLLVGDQNVLVIDAGVATTPREYLKPYMEQIGIGTNHRLFLLLTHSDADHCGGSASMKRLYPNLVTICHRKEGDRIENPDLNLQERYAEFQNLGISFSKERYEQLNKNLGDESSVDVRLQGGEAFKLSKEWTVDLLFAPGHTNGHMIVYDTRNKMAVITDAVLGKGIVTHEGDMAFGPTYRDTGDYLHTVQRVSDLDVDYLLTSHFPLIFTQDAIQEFMKESRDFVYSVRRYIDDAFNDWGEVTLRKLVEEAGSRLGTWPTNRNIDLCYCLQGGLEELQEKGKVRLKRESQAVWGRTFESVQQE